MVWRVVAGASLVLAVLAGCVAPRRVFAPPVDPASLNNAAFVHYLATVPTVTVAEGVRAVAMLADSSTPQATFDDQWAILEQRGAVKPSWRLAPDDTLDKGTLAYILTVVVKTPRSLAEAASSVTRLGDRRYALKTCIDEGLLPYGLPHDPVTGGELLSALSKAEQLAAVSPGDS